MPPSVAWLGHGGLLPFLFLALAGLVDPYHTRLWNDALIAYGAVILTLVGALRRGFEATCLTMNEANATQGPRPFRADACPGWSGWAHSPAVLPETC